MFLLEGTDLQREACTMVADSDPSSVRSVAHELCYLNVKSKLGTIDMIALGQISPELSSSAGQLHATT